MGARRMLVVLFGLAAACSTAPTRSVSTPTAPPSPTAARSASIRIVSIVSVPPGGAGMSWRFPADTRDLDVHVTLEGRGEVRVDLEVVHEPDGASVHSDSQTHDLDGRLELSFGDVGLPADGNATLTVEVRGPGVSASSRVTIRRG